MSVYWKKGKLRGETQMDKPVIMAVDDTQFVLDSVKSGLEDDYEIKTFLTGAGAVEYIDKNPVDLVLLDYDMPEMTGYEVLMNIRAGSSNKNVPVIFLTGVTNDRMELEMRERGAQNYIRKPIDFTVLRQCAGKWLQK
jgi:response regulator RpfG family c-di-GMP phosphodiesterase